MEIYVHMHLFVRSYYSNIGTSFIRSYIGMDNKKPNLINASVDAPSTFVSKDSMDINNLSNSRFVA